MKKRFAALCLTCSALLSLSAPAAAVRAPNDSGQPQSSTGNTSVTIPSDGTLSFDQIGPRVKANNLTLKAAQESLKSAEAMDWDEAIDEMEDAIDAMELQISMLVSSGAGELANAKKNLEHTLKQIAITEGKISNVSDITDGMFDSLSLIALGKYSEMQAASLKASLESMEDQLDDLQDQKEDYQKTLEDTARQIDYAAAQTIAGAESLYLTILSTQLQLEALQETMESTQRSLREVELRYELGQVSQLTLLQAQSGYDSLKASMDSLENTISTLYSSLQSLMGDVPTGRLTLPAPPTSPRDNWPPFPIPPTWKRPRRTATPSMPLPGLWRTPSRPWTTPGGRRERTATSTRWRSIPISPPSIKTTPPSRSLNSPSNPSTRPSPPPKPRCRPRRVPWPMRNRSTPWQSESTSWATSRITPFWTLRTR